MRAADVCTAWRHSGIRSRAFCSGKLNGRGLPLDYNDLARANSRLVLKHSHSPVEKNFAKFLREVLFISSAT